MFVDFYLKLRQAKLPVSLREYLTMLDGLAAGLADYRIEDFYFLARTTLVKDERLYDRFDRVFGAYFQGIDSVGLAMLAEIPEDWLRREIERALSAEDRAMLERLGWDTLLATLRQRLREQDKRHQGGNQWIGTAGRSPFGAYGDHTEAVRVGQDRERRGGAVKVWDRREYRNLDDSVIIGTRNIQMALRRLRRFVREGAATELDLGGTIRATADNAGYLDLKLRPERHNHVKLLLFFDVGGSMNSHARTCEELFSAARGEFKHLEYFYFHNCVYDSVWRDNRRRHGERVPTWQVIHGHARDWRLLLVGDASMSPYEITHAGGSIEHWNDEAGAVWLERLLAFYPRAAWLNPEPTAHWPYGQSIKLIRQIMAERMFALSLGGLDEAMKCLVR